MTKYRNVHVTRHETHNHPFREQFYWRHGRVAVIALSEVITDMPEWSWLDGNYWDKRARALGGTERFPVSSS